MNAKDRTRILERIKKLSRIPGMKKKLADGEKLVLQALRAKAKRRAQGDYCYSGVWSVSGYNALDRLQAKGKIRYSKKVYDYVEVK